VERSFGGRHMCSGSRVWSSGYCHDQPTGPAAHRFVHLRTGHALGDKYDCPSSTGQSVSYASQRLDGLCGSVGGRIRKGKNARFSVPGAKGRHKCSLSRSWAVLPPLPNAHSHKRQTPELEGSGLWFLLDLESNGRTF
jgi:hypothetical protein